MKQVSNTTDVIFLRADLNSFLDFRDCREIEVNPRLILHYVAGEVVEMKTLYDQDDHVVTLAVEARIRRAAEPVVPE
jgi:hypothetical protein